MRKGHFSTKGYEMIIRLREEMHLTHAPFHIISVFTAKSHAERLKGDKKTTERQGTKTTLKRSVIIDSSVPATIPNL
eukprot:5984443-Amphidinium_carterae.1